MVQKRANLFLPRKTKIQIFCLFDFLFFSTVYKSEKYRHSPSIGSCHDPHNLSIWGVQWIGEFWVGRAGANFSWYKRIIHVWQMLTSIIKIKSITQNIILLISSWSSFFLVICKIYKQFIYTAEKGL